MNVSRIAGGLFIVCGVAGFVYAAENLAPLPANNPAVQRAQNQVRMLDDIYKTSIVLVTQNYVDVSSDLAAGSAFQKLFAAMKDKGWHEVRLLDATGEPLVEGNKPRDDFEKQAIAALLDKKTSYERVVERNGKQYLRSATPIPPVIEKCHLCHGNYQGKDVIGALSYTIPID